ncbi:hypothetical protein LBW62_08050 [Ralstonia solanacearum]|uniref:hypothetical protein n=1 Tax=Ralstonia solanacearum TaxID=305 RepID=UPI0005C5DE9E|nr:hypothetical protein [Ralstonia solanacearum]MBB6592729.1 hypothetical protein [Ralstonia solanacearum]MBB6596951.1 hypothetical protein [Ralstonia solanacearum]MDB0541195.1 hypothetical protein [Ralstonia solanacearum]MDB0551431.1 hypothetical protein [Ralstonia solanacearum]MDB0556144.1 hypothetical protein [Ralstonia solanacearum]
MSLKNSLIAKVSRLELDTVSRIEIAARYYLQELAEIPPEYGRGREALCFALQSVALRRPALFWFGLASVGLAPALILLRVVL